MMGKTLAAAGVIALASTSAAHADVIIGNLADTSGGGTLFGGGATTVFKAAGFTMGLDAYSLDSVTLALTSATAGATPNMQIWSGAGAPTNLVYDMPDPVLPASGATTVTWVPAASVILMPGVTYWIYMDNTGGGAAWNWDSGVTDPTGPGATHAGYIFNGNPSTTRNAYEVNGTIPGPGVVALLSVACVLGTRRRRTAS